MSDPQQYGLGELGQRVQAMSDPAAAPASGPAAGAAASPANGASSDARLRPYQGAPLPIGSLSSRGPMPSYEPLQSMPPELRIPPAPAPPAAAPNPAAHVHPHPAPSQPIGQSPLRPFESAPAAPPSWEQVAQASAQGSAATVPPVSESSSSDSPKPESGGGSHNSAANPAPAPANPSDGSKSGFQRALDAIRSTIPIVQKLLPLLDGNIATALGALVAPQPHHHPPPVPVDLEPVERGLAEVRNSNRELRTQVQEQGTTLKRVEDQLERVREATDRNTLEQQELVEDLRAVGSRVGWFAIIGLILLLISLGLNGFLLFELQHILR